VLGEKAAAGDLERRRTGHAAAPEDAETLRVEASRHQAGLAGGAVGGDERHRRAAVERDARRRDHGGGVELGAGDRHGRQIDAGEIERARPDGGAAGEERLVEAVEVVAEGADDAGAGDGDRRAGGQPSR